MMKLEEIITHVVGKNVSNQHIDTLFKVAYASDLMSDVLRLDEENLLLITGLCNVQTIRTVEMADIECIVMCRGKHVDNEMVALAESCGIALVETPYTVFKVCGILGNKGINPID